MQRRKGFTLIELLVVIAIIGILATLVITQLAGARIKARNSSAKSDITEAGKAVEVFKGDELAGERVISAFAASTATNNPAASATADCTGAAATTCRVDNLNNTTASSGWLTGQGTNGTPIWATTQASVGSTNAYGNSYGVQLTKTPGTGYIYYYMTKDTGAAITTSGKLSVAGDYYFIADLGSTGATTDGVGRYYYVHNGNSGNNGSTGATTYVPAF